MSMLHRKLRVILYLAAVIIVLGKSCATVPQSAGASLTGVATGAGFDLGAYLEANGFKAFQGSMPVVHYSAESWKASLLKAIETARHSISIAMFVANRNEFDYEIYDALVRKAAEGVDVRYLFDGTSYQRIFDNPLWNDEIVTPPEAFRGTRVLWAEFNPLRMERLFVLPYWLFRDHRKVVIIDEELIYTGGYNLNVYSFAPIDRNGNVDAMVEIRSPQAGAWFSASFRTIWNEWSADPIRLDASVAVDTGASEPPEHGGIRFWAAEQMVARGQNVIEPLMKGLFDAAEHEIWMVQAYSIPSKAMIEWVRRTSARGVRIHIVLSEDHSSSMLDRGARYPVLPLMESGARVYIYKSPGNALLHYKLFFVDGRLAVFGSTNFNYRSLKLSNETALVFDDPITAGIVRENLADLLRYCREVSVEEARTWRSLDYMLNYVLSQIGG
ncbi:MAG: phosphatidylserine/phosphatidylglycerophosphate/cardiolipin synthase family protein [Spirochaetales bacterium]|nr:phosphatidylserine/phosphatidylglycerophosphate/cardiolipin synthase family protein [Spirochaetales bacterium]